MIDEVVGQWITVAGLIPTPFGVVAGFLRCRAFDIFKPWPASWADRNVKGGLGVMLDDVLAAVYAALALFALAQLGPFGDIS